MNQHLIRLTRGFDIKLVGHASTQYLDVPQAALFALKPTDLHGLAPIPKLHVREGEEVRAGQALFFDKAMPTVQFSSPVSGEIVEIRRGPRRAINEVVILADSEMTFLEFPKLDPGTASPEAIGTLLQDAGAWVLLRQRPFNVIPEPGVTPRDIFVSCFDTAPLAPDVNELISGSEEEFEIGLQVLGKLTDGGVHLGVSPASADVFGKASGAHIHTFDGPHPAGNVGVQIHHIRPVSGGEAVWTVKPQDVAIIGRLFRDGIFDARRTVAVTGPEVKRTGYYRTRIGSSIQPLVDQNLKQEHVRFVSGNVLSGRRIAQDGFLGLFDDQITVIEEGDQPEFMGWLMPSYPRPSISGTFLSPLFPNRRYRVNSNSHGEERAYVMTGEYERVIPMDLYPQHLIKAIIYRDYEQMEGLGIYEVVEEDLALCEFVCTSKQPVQKILREGLDAIRTEG
jgi:Na+-transporting NADH:ubiquinone oxidoreductase subunit A